MYSPPPPCFLNSDFVYFELEWDGRTIKLWKEGQLLVEYTDRDPYSGLDWIGFTSYDSVNPSNRIPSRWKFERNSFGNASSYAIKSIHTSTIISRN